MKIERAFLFICTVLLLQSVFVRFSVKTKNFIHLPMDKKAASEVDLKGIRDITNHQLKVLFFLQFVKQNHL